MPSSLWKLGEDGGEISKLLQILEKIGIPLNETLIVFDYDQTLSWMPIIEFKGKLVRSVKAELRGGEHTKQVLDNLKISGAKMVVITAKCDGKFAIESVALRMKPLGIQEYFDAENAKGEDHKIENMPFAFAGNVVGAGFNKPEGLKAFMDIRKIEVKHIVFVDDCADNVLQMFDNFLGHEDERTLTAIWWPPPVVEGFKTKEIHSEEALERMKVEAKAIQQTIYLYLSSNRRQQGRT